MKPLIWDRLLRHMQEQGFLNDTRQGFVLRKSCSSQPLSCCDDRSQALEDGKPVDVACLDFTKASDCVLHRWLIQGLERYGVRCNLLQWIEFFLTGRSQRVRGNNALSEWALVKSGIPQGSVLGPTLVIIFVNDLPSVVSSSAKFVCQLYKTYREVNTGQDKKLLQTDLLRLQASSTKWLPLSMRVSV